MRSNWKLKKTVDMVFTEDDMSKLYLSKMLRSLYYVIGWHITLCMKACKKSKGKLGKVMNLLFECGTVDEKDAKGIPTVKVERIHFVVGYNLYLNCILILT